MRSSEPLKVDHEGRSVTALVYAADGADVDAALILAHGAGAGQRSAFMVQFAQAIAGLGVTVVTFDFPYIEQGRRIPDRRPVLESCYRAVIARTRGHLASPRAALFIGGKSMGGRIATHVAAADPDLPVAGLVLLGYPLHPPGRADQLRDAHLKDVRRPMLIVQGSRDAFGTPGELAPVIEKLSPTPTLHVVDRGDHSFKVSRAGDGQAAVHDDIQRTIVDWIGGISRRA